MKSNKQKSRAVVHILSAIAVYIIFLFFNNNLYAQTVSIPGENYNSWFNKFDRSSETLPKEFKLINYFFTRGTYTNILGDPDALKGVSLGPIGIGSGSKTKILKDKSAYYIEQRWIPVLSYSPHFVDGIATFRAQFEVDYTWGRMSNSVQHNQGGGINADQVNMQTKHVNISIYPYKNPYKLSIVIGTQAIYDNISDPNITSLFDITQTGYKLTYIGTDATGISTYFKKWGKWKLSYMPLAAAKADIDDPRLRYTYLSTIDYTYSIQPGTIIGLSYWYLQDDTKGKGDIYQNIVPNGPGSESMITNYTGVKKLRVQKPVGVVNYFGLHFNHDIKFNISDFAASGFFMFNKGMYKTTIPETTLNKKVDLIAYSANLELLFKYGYTRSDLITFEMLYASGDSNPGNDKFTAPVTLNYYGLPGAVWFNHKTLILFPFTSTISNFTGAVNDISNQGYGLATGILSAAHDIIPNKLNIKAGFAHARSAVKPDTPEGTDLFEATRGSVIGTEVNLEIKYHFKYLMTAGLHTAYMWRGDFYNGNTHVENNPFALFTTLTWYGF